MKPMDSMVIEAGQIVHFQGIPVLLTENTRVMGNKANFKMKSGLDFLIREANTDAPNAAGDQS